MTDCKPLPRYTNTWSSLPTIFPQKLKSRLNVTVIFAVVTKMECLGTVLADDGHACVNQGGCSTNNGGCSHTCIDSYSQVFCLCPDGYSLASDWKTCKDNDECQESNGNCDQMCVNTPGGHQCECHVGFRDTTHITSSKMGGGLSNDDISP